MTAETHKHKFDIKDSIRVSLHDERDRASQKHLLEVVADNRTGTIVGKDTVKVWRCSVGSCEAYRAYDLERLLV